ncbi:branched-chain amino acid aminotransferase, partial [Bacillus subtilis]
TDTLNAITPVNRITHLNNEIILNSNQKSRITQQLYKAYKDIQTGKAEDIFNWTLDVKQLNEVEA